MRGYPYSKSIKKRAIKFRTKDRLSINEIEKKTKIPKGTLALWLRKNPLTRKEKLARRRVAQHRRKYTPVESKFHKMALHPLSKERKGKIAEAAILFRLALNGFNVFSSVFDGDHIDWVVEVQETKRLVRVEVRWARQGEHGRPCIPLRKHKGRNNTRHIAEDVDYVVGYDLFTDTAYVFTALESKSSNNYLSIRDDVAECWNKLRG